MNDLILLHDFIKEEKLKVDQFTDKNNIDDQQVIKMRVQNEIGIYLKNDLTRIKILKLKYSNNNVQIDDLIENEIDYIYLGIIDKNVSLCVNKSEVNYLKFMTLNQINLDMKEHREQYTQWFNLFMNDKKLICSMLNNLCNNK